MSVVITEQTALANEYLEKYSHLITYKHLVKVDENQIDKYVSMTGKVFPPDYCYWLTNYGSGLIEYIRGDCPAPSIYELR